MNTVERDILNTLRDLDTAVNLMRTSTPKPNLLPIFEKLQTLTNSLPQDTSPDLLHYLKKQSYEKARLFLEGRNRENERGKCDRS